MAPSGTNYNVTISYSVAGRAAQQINDINAAAEKAARGTKGLNTGLLALGAGFLGGRMFGAAKSALIGFNDEMAQAKIKIAGIMQMNLGGHWEKNMARATKSVERFQEMARKSPLTSAHASSSFLSCSAVIFSCSRIVGVGRRSVNRPGPIAVDVDGGRESGRLPWPAPGRAGRRACMVALAQW